jgi:uncharacterized protein YjbI with pentapeptide repeats|tara:strand:+ start:518 stop:712 length:195 start_codon:yes stop_codon:yes gene_type:complete
MPDGKRVYSNCKNVNLSDANLSKADLRETDLKGADLTGTRLDGAILCHKKTPEGKEDNSGCEKN